MRLEVVDKYSEVRCDLYRSVRVWYLVSLVKELTFNEEVTINEFSSNWK